MVWHSYVCAEMRAALLDRVGASATWSSPAGSEAHTTPATAAARSTPARSSMRSTTARSPTLVSSLRQAMEFTQDHWRWLHRWLQCFTTKPGQARCMKSCTPRTSHPAHSDHPIKDPILQVLPGYPWLETLQHQHSQHLGISHREEQGVSARWASRSGRRSLNVPVSDHCLGHELDAVALVIPVAAKEVVPPAESTRGAHLR